LLTTSGSPSFVGQLVTFTASVSSIYGAIPDGELVNFSDGTTLLGSAALHGGTATFTTSALAVKTHIIKATYPGGSKLFRQQQNRFADGREISHHNHSLIESQSVSCGQCRDLYSTCGECRSNCSKRQSPIF